MAKESKKEPSAKEVPPVEPTKAEVTETEKRETASKDAEQAHQRPDKQPSSPVEPTKAEVTEDTSAAGGQFVVSLNAPTPLTINPMTVDADSADEAWRKFCNANGICGSKCERTITQVK